MKTYKRLQLYIVGVLVLMILLGMTPKLEADIMSYLGQPLNTVPASIQTLEEQGKVYFKVDNHEIITEISVKDAKYNIEGIKVGDTVESIKGIFPGVLTEVHGSQIYIGIEESIHYGVITQQIVLKLDYTHTIIEQISKRYIAGASLYNLPITKEDTILLIEGNWLSQKNRELSLYDGVLEDNILDKLWDKQYYQVLAPNQLHLTRIKGDYIEKHQMYFWINKDNLYLFAINAQGLPLRDTIEVFIKHEK